MAIIKHTLHWEGIIIDVLHNDEWTNFPHLEHYVHHIEIKRRDNGQLPMTETGYRSHFLTGTNKDEPLAEWDGSAAAYVMAWLEEDSQSKKWEAYHEASKQLDLFS